MERALIVGALVAALACCGCAPEYRTDIFSNINAPKTAKRGAPVLVSLSLQTADGCEKAAWATAEVDDMQRVVTFSGATKNAAGLMTMCAQMISEDTTQTTFTPRKVGDYSLRVRILPCCSSRAHFDWFALYDPSITPREEYHSPKDETLIVHVTD